MHTKSIQTTREQLLLYSGIMTESVHENKTWAPAQFQASGTAFFWSSDLSKAFSEHFFFTHSFEHDSFILFVCFFFPKLSLPFLLVSAPMAVSRMKHTVLDCPVSHVGSQWCHLRAHDKDSDSCLTKQRIGTGSETYFL